MTAIPVRYRRTQRGLFAQKLQHAVPALIVLGDGVGHLQHAPSGATLALGLAEVLASLLVMGSIGREMRQLRTSGQASGHTHASHGVDWIDLSLGTMLMVEAYARFEATARLPRPTLVLGLGLIVIGLAHSRIAAWGDRRRSLIVDDGGISVPGRFFQRLSLPWSDVAEITTAAAKVRVIAHDGRDQELDLADAVEPDRIRAALIEARHRLESHRANGALRKAGAER